MKKSKIKFIIKQAISESYGKAGYTSLADKMLRLITKKLDKQWIKK
jgi:hypothetical protein